jgi:hypothetical protein
MSRLTRLREELAKRETELAMLEAAYAHADDARLNEIGLAIDQLGDEAHALRCEIEDIETDIALKTAKPRGIKRITDGNMVRRRLRNYNGAMLGLHGDPTECEIRPSPNPWILMIASLTLVVALLIVGWSIGTILDVIGTRAMELWKS